MTNVCCLLTVCLVASTPAAALAQRPWVEAKGPNVSVVSDAGEGRARDIAWQFEQVREAVFVTFPWIRASLSRPLVVVAARDVTTMRTLLPALFERPDGHVYTSSSAGGRDRAYVALRADVRLDDREGVNPYQSAYFAFASQALAETASGLPLWLRRGTAEVISNTLVRDKEIQVGRMLPGNLLSLRSRGRMALKDVVAMSNDDPRLNRPETLGDFDAIAWALVHFLLFSENGAHQKTFNAYVAGLLRGAEPSSLLSTTIGDVARLESPFNVYINRDLFTFAKVAASARLSREGFAVRSVPMAEALALRASLHVANGRPAEARALIAEVRKLDPMDGADEAEALLADHEDRDDDVRASLRKAIVQARVSWYVPYRLATLTRLDDNTLPDVERWLQQATALNPFADDAWAYLGSVMAMLGRGDASLGALEKAVALAPAESRHRVTLARVLRLLNRRDDAMKAAGLARALARTQPERDSAQEMLAELAKAQLAQAAVGPDARAAASQDASAAVPPGSGASEAIGSTGLTPERTGSATAMSPAPVATRVEAATTASDGGAPRPRDVGYLIETCFSDNSTCRASLPAIAGDCNGTTPTSAPACRNVGYILDVGIGMPSQPGAAADYYRKGCDRNDEVSCVRLATLRALGRGVPRDVAAALTTLEASCKNDLQEACFRLGVQLSSTKSPADLARAREVLTASCRADFAESCAWLKKLPPG